METVLVVVHLFLAIGLVGLVLIQHGKGADMGAAFGVGASQTLFGSSGAGTFLGKLTTAVAVIFMLTSLVLAYMSGNQGVSSVVSDTPAPIEAPAQPAPAPSSAPAVPADTK